MKVIENTAEKLVLRDRPWLLAGIVWAMGLVALYAAFSNADMDGWGERALVFCLGVGALAAAWWFFGFQTITFDRAAGTLTQEFRRIGSTRQRSMDLTRVIRARLQAERSESGARMERLAVETPDGPVALELGFSGFGRDHLATAINDWLGQDCTPPPV